MAGFNKAEIINVQMGCFPDRTLPEYKILPNERQTPYKRLANPNKNIEDVYSPNRADAYSSNKPFKRAPRQTPKKGKAQPVTDINKLESPKFNRQPKSSVLNINNDKQRKSSHKKPANNRLSIDRKVGKVKSSPQKDHTITEVQTPSESAKTSILAQLQNNPSIFFVKMGEKDLDLLFKTVDRNDRNEQKYHRLNYRSMSPRIPKLPSR